jgi:hypothetical protein
VDVADLFCCHGLEAPISVITDGDLAMQGAIRVVWSNSNIGCAYGILSITQFVIYMIMILEKNSELFYMIAAP